LWSLCHGNHCLDLYGLASSALCDLLQRARQGVLSGAGGVGETWTARACLSSLMQSVSSPQVLRAPLYDVLITEQEGTSQGQVGAFQARHGRAILLQMSAITRPSGAVDRIQQHHAVFPEAAVYYNFGMRLGMVRLDCAG